MSQPFSGAPDPGFPRRRRRFEPGIVQEALQAVSGKLRAGTREAKRHGQDLWRKGKRYPRALGLVTGAVAVTLAGAYTLSASGAGRSLCPAKMKKGSFVLLMDKVPQTAAGSELEIYYDVCGLQSGTPYKGRIRLQQQQRPSGKKTAAKVKPLTSSFQNKVDGPATRRLHEVELGRTKPGTYTLELTVLDNRGRERKRLQKVLIKTQ